MCIYIYVPGLRVRGPARPPPPRGLQKISGVIGILRAWAAVSARLGSESMGCSHARLGYESDVLLLEYRLQLSHLQQGSP